MKETISFKNDKNIFISSWKQISKASAEQVTWMFGIFFIFHLRIFYTINLEGSTNNFRKRQNIGYSGDLLTAVHTSLLLFNLFII